MARPLKGILAAAPTPIDADLAVDVAGVAPLLDHLARVGCHGALVLGTTGEGPCLSVAERRAVMDAAVRWREAHPDFLLLAGTGANALPDTVELTKHAVALGFDGQVVLPGHYFKAVSHAGISAWFERLADSAPRARILVYHIPRVSGVPVPVDVVAGLKERLDGAVVGIKDSSGDVDNTRALCRIPGLAVFTGTDSDLPACLEAGGAGAITALANVLAPRLLRAYDRLDPAGADAWELARARAAFEMYPSVAAIKGLLAAHSGLPAWHVRPPLEDMAAADVSSLASALGYPS